MKIVNLISSFAAITFLFLANNVVNATQFVHYLNKIHYEATDETLLVKEVFRGSKDLFEKIQNNPEYAPNALKYCGLHADAKLVTEFTQQSDKAVIDDTAARERALGYVQGIKNSDEFKNWMKNPKSSDLQMALSTYMEIHFVGNMLSLANKKASLTRLVNFQIWCIVFAQQQLSEVYLNTGDFLIMPCARDTDGKLIINAERPSEWDKESAKIAMKLED